MSPRQFAAAVAALIVGIVAGICWRALSPPPTAEKPIDDVRIPAERLLRYAPGVGNVRVLVYADDPKKRIIQIDDAHYIPLTDFAREARRASLRSGIKLADEEVRRLYCNHVDDLLDLRDDQLNLLRWLVDRYRLNCVFHEALCDESHAQFLTDVESFKVNKLSLDELADMMHQLPCAAQCAKYAAKVPKWERTVDRFLHIGFNNGPAGLLLLERPYVEVLAPEERVAMEEAYSELLAGNLGEKLKVREAIIVRRLLAHKGCSVIVLGAGHDLSSEVIDQSHGECEYVKVTPARFPSPPLWTVGGSWPPYGAGSK